MLDPSCYDSSARMPLTDNLHNSNYIGFVKIRCQQSTLGLSMLLISELTNKLEIDADAALLVGKNTLKKKAT